jgi:hypothetical protein
MILGVWAAAGLTPYPFPREATFATIEGVVTATFRLACAPIITLKAAT